MNTMVIALGVLSALVLAATAASLFAVRRAWILLQDAGSRQAGEGNPESAATQELRDAIQALGEQLHELKKSAEEAAATAPANPGMSFNLSRRSQVLRMHRRGESPDQIAASLRMPKQEVDLLLKVHRIVLTNV
jgi:DNA-binding NarL/FixJ family response regulator